ncbi:MAG: hypothetical protein RLZZ552_1388, partial [Verrucomicrobiota bacterium]
TARQPRVALAEAAARARGALAPVGVDATPRSLSVQSEREDLRAMAGVWTRLS